MGVQNGEGSGDGGWSDGSKEFIAECWIGVPETHIDNLTNINNIYKCKILCRFHFWYQRRCNLKIQPSYGRFEREYPIFGKNSGFSIFGGLIA